MFLPSLDIGDWVRAVQPIRTTITDVITGEGITPGTRGVIIARAGSLLEVEFDTGYGTTRAHVPARHLRLIRRRGGGVLTPDRGHGVISVMPLP